jgi:hypothetical protein
MMAHFCPPPPSSCSCQWTPIEGRKEREAKAKERKGGDFYEPGGFKRFQNLFELFVFVFEPPFLRNARKRDKTQGGKGGG